MGSTCSKLSMIHIFFDCGSFGSTIEFVLHNYTNHETKIAGDIRFDGSMHSFKKQYHITDVKDLNAFLTDDQSETGITTPTYPFKEFKLPEIIKHFSTIPTWSSDKKILVYEPDLRAAELNLLFKYHKVCIGTIQTGIEILVGDNQHNLSGWNPDYTHWSQMRPWELREWFSIFYPGFVEEFITARNHVSEDQWLIATNIEILHNTRSTLEKIIDHCGFVLQGDLDAFIQRWRLAQQYIVDEFDLLDNIVGYSIDGKELTWKPLNIIAESIVQQRLRALGYEIRCDGLDIFPTDSRTLHNLLEKI